MVDKQVQAVKCSSVRISMGILALAVHGYYLHCLYIALGGAHSVDRGLRVTIEVLINQEET